jgi:amidase
MDAGRLSAIELLNEVVSRIDRWNDQLNAIVTLDVEGARARARAADRALAAGDPVGALHGIPITVKDTIDTAGIRTTAGSPAFADRVPDEDALPVGRLKAAGANVLGKTNAPTFAGGQETANPIFGRTNNPWDVSRSPGGSSGGPAAALAAGLTMLELGSDNAGSIKHPSHYCGVYGHNPTHGVVPFVGHVPPPPGTLDLLDLVTMGPLARSPHDLRVALEAIVGPYPNQAAGWTVSLPKQRCDDLRDFRIAVCFEDDACPLAERVLRVLADGVTALAADGAKVTRVDLPVDLGDAYQIFTLVHGSSTVAFTSDDAYNLALSKAAELDPSDKSVRAQRLRAVTLSHRDRLLVDERRARLKALWRPFFDDFDVLLIPVSPVTALTHDPEPDKVSDIWHRATRTIHIDGEERPYLDQMIWPGLTGICGLPVTTCPVGLADDGLPVGWQVVSAPYLDNTTLRFAEVTADVVGGFVPPPTFDS